jgi:hypothetical protein
VICTDKPSFMKRILLFLFMLGALSANAQIPPFNNEWIDYNKTYYKFKVGATGVYRITQPTLASLGIGNTPAQHFQLWRNGQEVPVYTSAQTGPMNAGDFIEFWGEMNDGKPDNVMYREADFQLNDKYSLQTDTAAFFLTINTTTPNLRLLPTSNDVATSPLPVDPYFSYTAGRYYKTRIGQGYAQVVGENVYSSIYDAGEGWTSGDIGKGVTSVENFTGLQVYTGAGAPDPSVRIHASGYNGLNPRTFRVKINGDSLLGQEMNFFDYVKVSKTFPLALINSGAANVEITNQSQVAGSDRMVVATIEITYPRQFNFGNAANFTFDLPANTNGNLLHITNFNYGATAPALYDLTNGRRYIGDIVSTPGTVKFALLPSAANRHLVLVNMMSSNITEVVNFQQRNFVNYGIAANQGDYLIITHPKMLDGSGGSHPVDDYKAYRSSATGGGYNVKVYMIDELIDQFAFGIKKHPLSVRNFIRWARATYSSPLKNILLIGKGVQYIQYRANESHADIDKLAIIPTFGHPASDMLLSAEPGLNEIPQTPIGRLSVISADEITLYLNKVIQYEQAQAFQSPLIQDKAWMKNVAHVVGASEEGLQLAIESAMDRFAHIIKDTMFGANVHTFTKTSAETVEQATNIRLQNLFNEGMSIVTYFGHSSATTLEYNLDNPQNYNNQGKYPLFVLLGCNAGNFFTFNLARLQTKETISEKYVLADQRGSIASIASTHLGIVHYLDIYNTKNYTSIGVLKYGETLGETMKETITQVFNLTTQNDYYARFHCEQATLHGDPAIKVNSHAKPDYAIEEQLVTINPPFISTFEQSFAMKAKFMNLGKAVSDSITIEVKRRYPSGVEEVIQRDRIPGIRYMDSITYNIPIVGTRDKGTNTITITVDADNDVDELFETEINNRISKDIVIYEDESRTVYPYNYAIVNTQGIKFIASTANPLAPMRQYNFEIDTTELFNSPVKVTRSVNSIGGVLEFDPAVTFTDSTVYYWRVSPQVTSGQPTWSTASFIYLPSSELGFNQSHYYQHARSGKERITLDALDRQWKYDSLPHFLFAKNGVFLSATSQEGDLIVSPDGDPHIRSGCVGFSLLFNIFDPLKFRPTTNPSGAYESAPWCQPSRLWNFEYSYLDSASRRRARNFMDSIPDGYIVVVRTLNNNAHPAYGYVNDWIADEAVYGAGNTLYHKLKGVGFNTLDSFYRTRSMIFMYQKGNPAFTPASSVSEGIYDVITLEKSLRTPDTLGYITSPAFGRAKVWHQLKWRGTTPDLTPGDSPTVDIIGVDVNGIETPLVAGINISQQDYDISTIDAVAYPYLKLRMKNLDSVHFSPYQLRYWRLTYDPVPEGAIAPNLLYVSKDSVDVGEPFDFKIAFKNVTNVPFDSMKVELSITDATNRRHDLPIDRKRKLQGTPDTLQITTRILTDQIPGHNTLLVEVNPDNDQPEQYHFNNFVYQKLYVKPDSLNPLLDVTFDGLHILNRDIVSSKPDILIKLKDEAKWMILDDTSLLKLEVKFPNGDIRRFWFNNDTLQFQPAGQAPNNDNTATINFKPYFPLDGEYELIVTGRDRSQNSAGNIQYRVAFQVINKPMISNMLNYPNPFTTSTAFVFTITGSEVPQNIRIQIMTITGKIVRDITKDELGPLRIGRNITEFKWDGTDQYGQKLANGIYLYRVITNLNGKSLDKYKADGDNTDKYFNKGYGKMYLMR